MRILSVAAPGNGSGKTLTLAAILGAFPGRLKAVKFTTVYKDGVNCPRTERACACRELHGRFSVVTDPAVLAMEDTDTGRLTRSGASSVLWCLAQPGAHREAWEHLRWVMLSEEDDLLTEGNSIVPILDPDLLVMVLSARLPKRRWKPDTLELMRRADLAILNRHGCGDDELAALVSEVARERRGVAPIVEDVSRPLASWNDGSLLRAVESVLLRPGGLKRAAP